MGILEWIFGPKDPPALLLKLKARNAPLYREASRLYNKSLKTVTAQLNALQYAQTRNLKQALTADPSLKKKYLVLKRKEILPTMKAIVLLLEREDNGDMPKALRDFFEREKIRLATLARKIS